MSFPIAHSLRPAVRGLIAAILVAAFSAGPAPAETIRQQGGDVYSGSEGPWHLFRISMERGIRACSAYNFNHRRREPTISVIHFIEDGESGIGF